MFIELVFFLRRLYYSSGKSASWESGKISELEISSTAHDQLVVHFETLGPLASSLPSTFILEAVQIVAMKITGTRALEMKMAPNRVFMIQNKKSLSWNK